jgi:NAD(P)-dependent dehydrogenase (short-subunit alcohol dehydrogenase family)
MDLDHLYGEKIAGKWQAYANSKLYNALFVAELHRRHGTVGITAVAVRPGAFAEVELIDKVALCTYSYHLF